MPHSSSHGEQPSTLQQAAHQIAACADQLFQQVDYQQALSHVIDNIRSSLDIVTLFKTTTAEIRSLLKADRVEVFRFTISEGTGIRCSGRLVAESVAVELNSALNIDGYECFVASEFVDCWGQQQVQAIADIYQASLQPCYLKILKDLRIRASLVVPIVAEEVLWGLLCIHQCDRSRNWQLLEIEFVQKISNHFAIALQKAEYLEQHKAAITAQSKAQAKALARQNSLIKIISKIRQSLDLSEICKTATEEVHRILEADRAAIYRFNPDWSGSFLYESVDPPWVSLLAAQKANSKIAKNVSECSVSLLETIKTVDTHLVETQGGVFSRGEVFRICPDIYSAGFSNCYIEVLESYQAQAYVIVAIYIHQKLWGLLAAYQNSAPRHWKESEVQLLVNIAEQLGVALKQAEYVQTIEKQSIQLNQTLEKLKQSQAQLVQNEKMASLGQFVAGIAHEINNPVNFIYGNLSYIDEYVQDLLAIAQAKQASESATEWLANQPSEQPKVIDFDFIQRDLPKALESMKVGAERIRNIVLSLRNFSRLDEAEVKAVDIHQGIESTLLILGHRLKANGLRPAIEVVKNYGHIPPVECYPAQLNQVFMNLLSNAIDAVEETFEPNTAEDAPCWPARSAKIWISTEFHAAGGNLQGEQVQGEIEIRIRDSGVGLQSQDVSKLFDYFYTTKPIGKGTGLGLAIARQIVVERHCGQIQVASGLDQGAEFTVRLPLTLSNCLLASSAPSDH